MSHPPDNLDTIAAISTPPGRGGIGIVRLSGPHALTIAAQLLQLTTPLDDPALHARARFTRILDPNDPARTLDDALVTVFHAPNSYTGDTLIEIAAHGSPVILDAILRSALAHGARLNLPVRLAAPGEFTQRAFLSGRLDLTQAEAVHDLIAAQTLDQARVAAQQLGGALARRIAPAKESLLHLIALLEAGMDFASGELDDVDVVPPAQIGAAIGATQAPLQALATTFRRGQLLRDGAAIALIGPPNAGKSSLFNRLLERDRSIVTPIPGTTRDTVEESLSLGGIPLRLIDTAGLRGVSADAEPSTPLDLAEQHGIARTHEALADADLVLLIHDATQSHTPAEHALAASLAHPHSGRPHLLVHNKVDLLPPSSELSSSPDPNPSAQNGYPGPSGSSLIHSKERGFSPLDRPILTSALTGSGLDDLRSAILAQLGATGSLAETGLLNNLRQQEAVTAALAALAAAEAANTAALPHELILVDLHTALRALDSLTGVTTSDDILARIFSTFCIGK